MVTTNLMGGLGNQMFQISAAYNLAKINNDTPIFNFNNCITTLQGNKSVKYIDNIFSKFDHSNNIRSNVIYREKKFSYDKISYANNICIEGYFQSEKYFAETKNELSDKFINGLKNDKIRYEKVINFLNKIDKKIPLVSVHIRRGDYLNYPLIHSLCSLQYYNESLNLLKQNIGDFIPIFVSDDKKWCLDNFKDGLISPFNDEIEDFILMMNCNHNIIANSTFSWWGAYLNETPDKIIIAPKNWFGPNGHKDQQDIIPNNWIKI